ncbi:MAG: YidB family protein [Gemmatimonadales bacterium]
MGLFDGLGTELSSRFGLGDKAGPLLSALLSLITDSDKGGLAGFLDRLRRGGLGDQVASWVGTGTNATVAPE